MFFTPFSLLVSLFLISSGTYAGVTGRLAIHPRSEPPLDDAAPSNMESTVSPLGRPSSIYWPLDSAFPITDPSSNITSSNQSVGASIPTCNGRLYGRNLQLASCIQVFRAMSSDTVPVTFGERGGQGYDAPLPFRYLSHDGRCAIDVAHAVGVKSDSVVPLDLKNAAWLLIQVCVSIKPNEGGLITGLGENKGLSIRMVPYKPR